MNALFVAWRSGEDQHAGWGPVGRLEHDGSLYRFYYTHGARTMAGFRPFSQMESLDAIYESEELFPLFANRLLSESRPEYEAFLTWAGFDPAQQPDPIALLGVTEGIRQTDAIEVFPCPIPDGDGCYTSKFFLHGIRWMPTAAVDRIHRLHPNEQLFLMPDPYNRFDPNAVGVRTENERTLIGYVPRYLAHDVCQLLDGCARDYIELIVDRVNRDAPLQQRMLCRMRACWPNEFEPYRSQAFQPIPHGLSVQCHH